MDREFVSHNAAGYYKNCESFSLTVASLCVDALQWRIEDSVCVCVYVSVTFSLNKKFSNKLTKGGKIP